MALSGVLAVLLWGCGGGGLCPGDFEPISLPTAPAQTRVLLPSGAPLAPTSVTVRNALNDATPAADGAAQLTLFAESPQFVAAYAPGGRMVLCGFVSPAHPDLDAKSTAVAFAYFKLGLFVLPAEDRDDAVEILHAATQLAPVISAIEAALVTHPNEGVTGDTAVQDALTAACTQLQAHGRGLLIQPPDVLSGVFLDNSTGLNQFKIRNDYRRRIYYWVKRISYIDGTSGHEVPSPAIIEEGYGPVAQGVGGLVSTIVDILRGREAYTPKYSDPITMPIYPPSAKRTNYRMQVVGCGQQMGNDAELSAQQRSDMENVHLTALLLDVAFPFTLNIVSPLTTDMVDDLMGSPLGATVVKDFAGILSGKVPATYEKARKGKLKEAGWDVVQTMTTNSTFRKAMFALALKVVAQTRGAQAASALGQAFDSINEVIKGVDLILASWDLSLMMWQMASSNTFEAWDVAVTQPELTFTPEQADLGSGGAATFTVNFPPGEETQAQDCIYGYSMQGDLGMMSDDLHPATKQPYKSTRPWVTFTAATGVTGQAKVQVEVLKLVSGSGGTQEHRIALLEATVNVQESEPIRFLEKVATDNWCRSYAYFIIKKNPSGSPNYDIRFSTNGHDWENPWGNPKWPRTMRSIEATYALNVQPPGGPELVDQTNWPAPLQPDELVLIVGMNSLQNLGNLGANEYRARYDSLGYATAWDQFKAVALNWTLRYTGRQ